MHVNFVLHDNGEVAAKQGFLMYYSNRDAVGTKISGDRVATY